MNDFLNQQIKNIKRIDFSVKMKGEGCVNFDDSNKSQELKGNGYDLHKYGANNNVKYAKRIYEASPNSDDVLPFYYKVSSQCLRHNIFEDEIPESNTTCFKVDSLRYRCIATPAFLMRGFMYAKTGEKRKSSDYL